MTNTKSTKWAMVPARGGSKSIPKKNLVPLGGRAMLDYGVRAALASACFARIFCSTDDQEIAARAQALGIEVDWRPAQLATDEAAVADVAREFLARQTKMPDILALIQPTSPFLLPEHVSELMAHMDADPEANSGQTVCPVIHNYHAWNQRIVEEGRVRFKFAEERRTAFNKQRKPKLYTFGNLVAVRPRALMAGADFFAEPSVAVEIAAPYNLDVDTLSDLRLAELLVQGGVARLPDFN